MKTMQDLVTEQDSLAAKLASQSEAPGSEPTEIPRSV